MRGKRESQRKIRDASVDWKLFYQPLNEKVQKEGGRLGSSSTHHSCAFWACGRTTRPFSKPSKPQNQETISKPFLTSSPKQTDLYRTSDH